MFRRLYLPKWDLDFIRRVLWEKLPVGVRMEQLGAQAVHWTGGWKIMHMFWKGAFSRHLCLTPSGGPLGWRSGGIARWSLAAYCWMNR